MKSPLEIQLENRSRVNAIFEKFVSLEDTETLSKSHQFTTNRDTYWTKENLADFQNSLNKSIDEDTISDEDLEKAQSDLLSLKKVTRVINGEETTVFVKETV